MEAVCVSFGCLGVGTARRRKWKEKLRWGCKYMTGTSEPGTLLSSMLVPVGGRPLLSGVCPMLVRNYAIKDLLNFNKT